MIPEDWKGELKYIFGIKTGFETVTQHAQFHHVAIHCCGAGPFSVGSGGNSGIYNLFYPSIVYKSLKINPEYMYIFSAKIQFSKLMNSPKDNGTGWRELRTTGSGGHR